MPADTAVSYTHLDVYKRQAYIGGICAEGAASYTRKQLDQLTEFVKRPQIGAKGMVYAQMCIRDRGRLGITPVPTILWDTPLHLIGGGDFPVIGVLFIGRTEFGGCLL